MSDTIPKNDMKYREATSVEFERELESFTDERPEYEPFLTTDRDFSDCVCYLDYMGDSGFAITTDREIVALFNGWEDRSLGDQLVFEAVKRGGRWLNCFSGYLGEFYFKHGFETVAYLPWDDDEAPDSWDYEEYGRPDVLFMSFNPPHGVGGSDPATEAVSWEQAAHKAQLWARPDW
jgi:hypothetical protein